MYLLCKLGYDSMAFYLLLISEMAHLSELISFKVVTPIQYMTCLRIEPLAAIQYASCLNIYLETDIVHICKAIVHIKI